MSDSTVRCQKCGHLGVPSPTVVLDLESEIRELRAEMAELHADRERLDWIGEQASRRQFWIQSETVRQDGNLLAADGWTQTWHVGGQGLVGVNHVYHRSVRQAIDAARDKETTCSGRPAPSEEKA
jgi:hypothetical protein